jgi:hypothetical protein
MAEFLTAFVAICDTLSADPDDWIAQPHLRVAGLVMGCGTTIDSAMLLWDVGYQKRESLEGNDADQVYVDKLAIQGKYCRITVDFELVATIWYGFVLTDELERGPEFAVANPAPPPDTLQKLAYANQTCQAVGLEWFLQRQTVHSSFVHGASGDVRIERAIGFNSGFGRGRSVTYEKRENMHADGLTFAAVETGAQLWTGTAAVKYLLKRHGPKNASGAFKPVEFELAIAAEPFLDWFTPTVETEGHSVYQILNAIIDNRRGLSWWMVVGVIAGEMRALINVSSMATADIVMPGGETLPAAQYQSALPDLDAEEHQRVLIKRDGGRRFDRIICRGARRRAVFTVSTKSENLVPSWDAGEETYYKIAASSPDGKVNDRYRQAKRFERVYQAFHIPPDWNGASNDGSAVPGSTEYSCPHQVQDSTSIVGAEPLAMAGLRLLRLMPIKAGWDYDNATAPTVRNPTGASSEFQPSFAAVDVGGGKWRFVEEINTNVEADNQPRKTSYRLHVLDNAPGLRLSPSGGMPHAAAKNHFDPMAAATSAHSPEVDYEDIRFTVAGEWDAYCEAQWPIADAASDPLQTLYISIGNRARHDWLAAGTVYDVQNGAIKKVTTGGALRDDRVLCAQVARLAFEWYGQPRAEIEITTVTRTPLASIGVMITSIGTLEATEATNAFVSQIQFDFIAGAWTIRAGFTELDPSRFV